MPARKQPTETHWYNVAILAYVDGESRRITAKVVYSGDSWPRARIAIGNALIAASRNQLAYSVHILCDYEPIVRVQVEHL
jgi:hypothetical protein